MEKIKIVIPSHKRHDAVTSAALLQDPIICVAKSQVPLYKEFNPTVEILSHPDSLIGLPLKRQWLYEKFGALWMVDDDITGFRRVYTEDNYQIKSEEITEILQSIFRLAEALNVFLFGISKNPHPVQYNAHVMAPIALTGFISGGVHGVRGYSKGSKVRYKPGVLNNDFYISLLNAYHHRRCLIDYRFAFTQKGTFSAPGGNAEFRTKDGAKNDYLEMKRLFGDSVSLKKDRVLAKAKVQHALSGRIKI